MPAHHHEANCQRCREHEAERPPQPRPENRGDDQRDGRDASMFAVEQRSITLLRVSSIAVRTPRSTSVSSSPVRRLARGASEAERISMVPRKE